jgi:prepilin peptidase CpaA
MLQATDLPSAAAAMAAQPHLAVLVVMLLAAAATDLHSRRIPNWLTYGGAIAGLAISLGSNGPGPAWPSAMAGLLAGLAVLLPLHVLRVLGAGDVKLMAAAGVFLGPVDVLYAALFTFIAGGVAALVFVAWRRSFGPLAANLRSIVFAGFARAPLTGVHSVGRMPYAIAICAGTLAWLVVRHTSFF